MDKYNLKYGDLIWVREKRKSHSYWELARFSYIDDKGKYRYMSISDDDNGNVIDYVYTVMSDEIRPATISDLEKYLLNK